MNPSEKIDNLIASLNDWHTIMFSKDTDNSAN